MKIAVLCGGVSSEREVSLNSGAAVASGLAEAGFDAALEDVNSVSETIRKWRSLGADGAFIALHGGWGEDGRLQSALEAAGIPYTGSGAKACMICMDKEASRDAASRAGIPVPPGIAVRPGEKTDFGKLTAEWEKIVVKPANNGSTVGVAITSDTKEASEALNSVWDIDTKAIVEKFIAGRELTAAVFGTGHGSFSLPVIEIRPRSGFYDYKSKYTKGETEYLSPAPLDEKITRAVMDYACRAHKLFGCRAYSRADFRLSDDGTPYFLEVNTAPGMTSTSLVPKAALAHGWSFPELLARIAENSFGPSE
ncbi:MAG: D-alanine--D-alanine ligase [Synergistaceae bacterium]|jgi:D-alanine-D-alanine ligase|nr:D-alanine--D-alanine ligase [Synergistaceae bacterium]